MGKSHGGLRGWGPGWPTNQAKDMVWARCIRSGAKWQVHKHLAPLVEYIVNEIERRGYLFDHGPQDVDDDWGFANRPIGGTKKASEHSRGIAIDFDAQEYPQHSKRRPPQWILDFWAFFGFEIGADWSLAYVDPMHVEFAGSVTEAQFLIAALAASHLERKPVPLPATVPPPLPSKTPTLSEEDDMFRFYISHAAYGIRLCEADGTTYVETGVRRLEDVDPRLRVIEATPEEVNQIRSGYRTTLIR